jgi:hypothetical protein
MSVIENTVSQQQSRLGLPWLYTWGSGRFSGIARVLSIWQAALWQGKKYY